MQSLAQILRNDLNLNICYWVSPLNFNLLYVTEPHRCCLNNFNHLPNYESFIFSEFEQRTSEYDWVTCKQQPAVEKNTSLAHLLIECMWLCSGLSRSIRTEGAGRAGRSWEKPREVSVISKVIGKYLRQKWACSLNALKKPPFGRRA